jgi:uncharacterized protein (TIGR03067 family)
MKTILVIAFCGAAILASGCSTLHKSDSADLQGTWKGQEMGGGTGGTYSLLISGNTLEFRGEDENEWYKGTFTLRENKIPHQVVVAITQCSAPQYVGETTYAIYRLEGDSLTLTGNEPGNPAVPSGFDAQGARAFVLKRQ